MPRILIIEDEPGVQMTLEDRLVAEGYQVTIKGDGIRGEEAAKTGEFDIILLDLMLPGRDGFAVCQHVRAAGIHTPILMLTARNTNLDVVLGLRQGADDYLAKPFDMGVLIARIEALLRRSSQLQLSGLETSAVPDQVFFGEFCLNIVKGILETREGRQIELNTQEYRLLKYMVLHPGYVLTRDTILNEVWGYGSDTTTRTVDVHIAKLRQRLGESNIPKHIRTIRGRGYKFLP